METKPNILIVDDKVENLIALEKLLAIVNATIIRAGSGNEALAKTLEHEFALALIDVQMPDMDGYETVKLMRQVKDTQYLPVIFISAIYSEDHYLIEGIEAGAVDFITKPIIPRILLGKIKIFLQLHEQKQQLLNEINTRIKTEENLRKTEKELTEAKTRAENSDHLKSVFLANMSHELRTPLNSILGFANLLRNNNPEEEDRKKYLNYINNAGESLLTLINDVIDLAKIEADQLKISNEQFQISSLLHEIYDIYTEELKRKNKENLILKLTTPQESDSITIYSDIFRLRQILTNFLTNAIKFTMQGSIEFGYELKNHSIEFFVKDTGIGIAPNKTEEIFERFVQVENTRNDSIIGTGLGLAISKKLSKLLHGKIFVVSEVNKGSTFYLSLPLDNGKPGDILNEGIKATPQLNNTEIKSVQILIAEDEEINFFFIKEALRCYNFNILWGKNGLEAVKLFEENPDIELVLMDIKMPIMDGYQALERIKNIRNVPVIAQTAYAMSGEKNQIIAAGFDEYLSKPINIKLLRTVIAKYLTISN